MTASNYNFKGVQTKLPGEREKFVIKSPYSVTIHVSPEGAMDLIDELTRLLKNWADDGHMVRG